MFQCFNVSLKQMDGLGFLRGFYAIYEPAQNPRKNPRACICFSETLKH